MSSESSKKKRPPWSWLLLAAMLIVWFASTWILSLSALKTSNEDNEEEELGFRRPLSDFSQEKTLQDNKMLPKESQQQQHSKENLPLIAYLEGPLPPYDASKTPRLPSRTPGPLKQIIYENSNTCADFPNAFPIQVPQDNTDCPIMADPFLPWIHDVFVDASQQHVHFIAHNQRRCNTDPKQFFDRLAHLEPQAILQQSVPVAKVFGGQYKLTSLEQADHKETRFLCRFHTAHHQQTLPITLSQFAYNYEHANFQKRNAHALLTRPKDHQDSKVALHNEQVWNSLLHFQCPLLAEVLPLLNSQTSTVYVDVAPIRTYGRLDRAGYFD